MELAPIIGTLAGGLLAIGLSIYFWVAAGGHRTQAVFFTILGLVLLVVTGGLAWQKLGPGNPQPLVAAPTGPVQVRVLTALPAEPWVRQAADKFNKGNFKQDGQPIDIQIIAMDGLTALGKFDQDSFGSLGDKTRDQASPDELKNLETNFPTVWIPDTRYLVELSNAAYKARLGRDVFLTDGEYRARPTVISLFAWGIYQSRDKVLEAKYGPVTWKSIHDAAIAKGGWAELGGDPSWNYFKLVVPNPRKNAGGLAAMIAAAGEYYDRTNISVADVNDPKFQQWLGELMSSVTSLSGGSAYTVEDFALFGYSEGDGGQMLESDLLTNMQGIKTRWADPLVIRYPKYVTWFDFPFSIWMGPETTAAEKNAALQFEQYLLSPDVQKEAVAEGLRPVNNDVSVTAGDTFFTRYKDQGVEAIVPRTARMASPGRDVLLSLLRWYDLNVAK
jgi:Bacterial extracellular solute-binding protein